MYKEALTIRTYMLGENHPLTAFTMNALGMVYDERATREGRRMAQEYYLKVRLKRLRRGGEGEREGDGENERCEAYISCVAVFLFGSLYSAN